MTWRTIIDNNLTEEYEKKAQKQKYVYMCYSSVYPYLPVFLAFSLYEIAKHYNVNENTIIWDYYHGSKNIEHGFTIEFVKTSS